MQTRGHLGKSGGEGKEGGEGQMVLVTRRFLPHGLEDLLNGQKEKCLDLLLK